MRNITSIIRREKKNVFVHLAASPVSCSSRHVSISARILSAHLEQGYHFGRYTQDDAKNIFNVMLPGY